MKIDISNLFHYIPSVFSGPIRVCFGHPHQRVTAAKYFNAISPMTHLSKHTKTENITQVSYPRLPYPLIFRRQYNFIAETAAPSTRIAFTTDPVGYVLFRIPHPSLISLISNRCSIILYRGSVRVRKSRCSMLEINEIVCCSVALCCLLPLVWASDADGIFFFE